MRSLSQPRRTLRVARRYAASPARVFDAWLDPAVARQWLFATASHPLAHVEIDARVKGSFCFVDRQDAVDGTRYTGEYLEITPPQRLVFTLSVAKFVETRVTVVTMTAVDQPKLRELATRLGPLL